MQNSWLLVAFGFGNVAMLGWLAAAAAPLLIHLWSRRRYREVPWAAVSFLLAAIRKHSRRIQLQQWLLLAVRTSILLLVVLAVAEPFAEQPGAGVGNIPTHRVLVVDTSFSMSYRGDGDDDETRLARAKRLATQLIDKSSPADAFTVITLADPPRELVGRDVVDRASISAQIDAIAQSHGHGNLAATLDLVEAAIQLDANERERWPRQEVHFFTDMQRATWLPNSLPLPPGEGRGEGQRDEPSFSPSAKGREATDEFQARFAALAKQAAITVVDLGSPRAANLAATDLRVSGPFVTVGRDATFDATLHQFGDQPRTGCSVEFLVDDLPVGEQTVDVSAGGDAIVRFTHRFRDAGSHAVAVRAAGDRLELDNTRWLVVPVDERVNVLCVGGGPSDTKYVADALDPDRTDESPIHVEVITEGELAETELAQFGCVFLCNVAQLTADEAARLARYAEQGSGLAIFLGDRVMAASYNALAGGEESLLPARLEELVAESRFGLDPLEYRHPIVAPFRGRERAGLLTTPIARYFRLKMLDGRKQAEVALALPGGDPLIVTAPLGRGRTVLVATAGSLATIDAASGEPWTTWPAWPSFLPVVREILAYAAGGRQDSWQTLVGAPLVLNARPNAGENATEISRPDGRTATMTPTSSAAGRQWSYQETNLAGIYTVRQGATQPAVHFAVNVDTRESDLAQVDPQKLPPELVQQRGAASAASYADAGALPHVGWQRSLLWTALGLLLTELFMAWQFGRGAA